MPVSPAITGTSVIEPANAELEGDVQIAHLRRQGRHILNLDETNIIIFCPWRPIRDNLLSQMNALHVYWRIYALIIFDGIT